MPTLTIRNRILPGGEELTGDTVIQDITGPYTLHAWPTISIETSPGVFMLYHFFIWNINGGFVSRSLRRDITVTNETFASAWYVSIAEFQPPPSTLYTHVFHLDTDQVVPNVSPIFKTLPESSWAGGQSTVVSTTMEYYDMGTTTVIGRSLGVPNEFSKFQVPWYMAFGMQIGDGYQFRIQQYTCDLAFAFYRDEPIDPNPDIEFSDMNLDDVYIKARKIKSLIKQLSLPGHAKWNSFLLAMQEMEIMKRSERDELSGFLAGADQKNKAELKRMQSKVGRSIKRLDTAAALLRKAIDALGDKK